MINFSSTSISIQGKRGIVKSPFDLPDFIKVCKDLNLNFLSRGTCTLYINDVGRRVQLLYGMKFLRVLIFAIFSTIRKTKFPQKNYSPQKFVTQKFTPLLKLSRLLFNAKVHLCIFIQIVPFV